ncbi:uncharacterized protein LAESUDRAFT_728505 [Laetiporus sulphureus 93-53]|uniref:Secreted protein n=1 Tax=Laetiporus sulphureus 93-53 TaxID=1314785 RepID=A0A165D2G2_9APHY|nr:uncharacterized protein LAESUDRAFT_728505 [Laetiporus sulphureus 93-53]KZT04021.1 hypothetical protein LAESUDRAFT_728505 [Laetiporus sulphureus 93-53]
MAWMTFHLELVYLQLFLFGAATPQRVRTVHVHPIPLDRTVLYMVATLSMSHRSSFRCLSHFEIHSQGQSKYVHRILQSILSIGQDRRPTPPGCSWYPSGSCLFLYQLPTSFRPRNLVHSYRRAQVASSRYKHSCFPTSPPWKPWRPFKTPLRRVQDHTCVSWARDGRPLGAISAAVFSMSSG